MLKTYPPLNEALRTQLQTLLLRIRQQGFYAAHISNADKALIAIGYEALHSRPMRSQCIACLMQAIQDLQKHYLASPTATSQRNGASGTGAVARA